MNKHTKIYLCGNFGSKSIRNKVFEILKKNNYNVVDYVKSGNYVLDCQAIAYDLRYKINENNIAIFFANISSTLLNVTEKIFEVKNFIVNKQNKLSVYQAKTANIISIGIQEFSESEIIKICLFFVENKFNDSKN